jgi:hypothetical protein
VFFFSSCLSPPSKREKTAAEAALSLISLFKNNSPAADTAVPVYWAFTGASIGRPTPDFLTNGRRLVFRSNRLCRSAVSPGELLRHGGPGDLMRSQKQTDECSVNGMLRRSSICADSFTRLASWHLGPRTTVRVPTRVFDVQCIHSTSADSSQPPLWIGWTVLVQRPRMRDVGKKKKRVSLKNSRDANRGAFRNNLIWPHFSVTRVSAARQPASRWRGSRLPRMDIATARFFLFP